MALTLLRSLTIMYPIHKVEEHADSPTRQRRAAQRNTRMHLPCPHGDQPDASLLRLVLMGAIFRADATLRALLADLLQQSGLLHLSKEPTAPPVRPQTGTLHPLRRSDADSR